MFALSIYYILFLNGLDSDMMTCHVRVDHEISCF